MLREAGFSAKQIYNSWGNDQIETYKADKLFGAGYPRAEVLKAGFSATALRAAGCSAKEVHAAGFVVTLLGQGRGQGWRGAGYSTKELQEAGCSMEDLSKAGHFNVLGYEDSED